jgi:uncharacterized membrane protein (DUF485 family)
VTLLASKEKPYFYSAGLDFWSLARLAPLSSEASASTQASNFSASRLGLILLVMLGVLFFVFMGTAAFAPGFFAGPVVHGGTVSKWFAFAIGLIWLSVLATGFYVFSVNAAEDRS